MSDGNVWKYCGWCGGGTSSFCVEYAGRLVREREEFRRVVSPSKKQLEDMEDVNRMLGMKPLCERCWKIRRGLRLSLFESVRGVGGCRG